MKDLLARHTLSMGHPCPASSTGLIESLEAAGVVRPVCDLPKGANETGWRVADVEMALFAWADCRLQRAKAKQVDQEQ